MKAVFLTLIFLTMAVLSSCMFESDPSVMRSRLRIEAAKRGDLLLPTGLLKDVTYVEKPALCSCTPNSEQTLFVLSDDGHSASQVKTRFGQSSGNFVEVQHGLKPGDRVIVSDMAAYDSYRRIDLR
jgi:multidrug efflux pump subunit AcrA (membrane-fusion protein)